MNTLYLDLIKRCLTAGVYGGREYAEVFPRSLLRKTLVRLLASRGLKLMRPKPPHPVGPRTGMEFPSTAHTMIGLEGLNNLQDCLTRVIVDEVPGDLMETGVWRGGAAIFMKAVLRAHGDGGRRVWLADSFAGLPPPDPANFPADAGDELHACPELAVPLEEVRANFERYGLLDERVRFLKGWFRDTLPSAPVERLALLRLDGDMYESTMLALTHLYPKLSPGGYLIVDDYVAMPSCREAVDEYRRLHRVEEPIETIGLCGVYWRRRAP